MTGDPPVPAEPDAPDHENKREKRTLEEITEQYLALLRAEKEKARRRD